jgi:hypothetical protein
MCHARWIFILFGKPCNVMMSMQYLFIFTIEAFHFIFGNCHTDNKAISSKELVIELGEGMGVSDPTEPMGVEEGIYSSEMAMVYL